MQEITRKILQDVYKERPKDSKKYDFGLLTIIGGSQFYSGSPAFAALAAFRAGVDMVKIIAPKRAADIIASFKPDLAAYPLEGDWLEKKHLATLISMIESAKAVSKGRTALVIGGGMGRSKETQQTIVEFLSQVTVPTVVDADAIYALADNPQVISGKNCVITPHSYEFLILTKREVHKLPQEEQIKIVQEEAAKLQTTILLKGATDIISDGEQVSLGKTGNPYMTVGGSGDTLAGICGALLARNIAPFLASQAAALINGLAGDKAGKEFGESMTASDLIEAIPEVIK